MNIAELNNLDEATRLEVEGFRTGTYMRLEIRDVPFEMVQHFEPCHPILVGGIGIGDENVGYMQAKLKQHRWHKKVLKPRDPIIVSIGWGHYQTNPVYATEDQNGRHRMLKYTPEHMHCLAMFWGPVAPSKTGILAVQNLSNNQPIERKQRKFNPLVIPSALQAKLPFQSKPKDKSHRKRPSLEDRRPAVVMEPHEKRVNARVKRLLLMRNEKMKKRKLKDDQKRKEMEVQKAKEEELSKKMKERDTESKTNERRFEGTQKLDHLMTCSIYQGIRFGSLKALRSRMRCRWALDNLCWFRTPLPSLTQGLTESQFGHLSVITLMHGSFCLPELCVMEP